MNSSKMRLSTLSLTTLLTLTQPTNAQRIIYQDLRLLPDLLKAHGIIMGLAFTVMMPLGIFAIRFLKFKGAVWVHAAWQLLSWIMAIAGLATGVRIAKILDRLHNNTHTILGTVVIALLLLQPFLGLLHHAIYRKSQKPTSITHLHVWNGRILVILGIINGGLGLQLAGNTRKGEIAWGVVGGVFGLAVVLLAVLVEMGVLGSKERGRVRVREREKISGSRSRERRVGEEMGVREG